MSQKISYTALFVDNIPVLKKLFPPKFEREFYHHSTIAFQPADLTGLELGRKQQLKIIGIASDEKCEALLVLNPKSLNKYPHITLSTAEGISPNYSNEMLARAVEQGRITIFELPFEIAVTEGYVGNLKEPVTA
jgi:hypothetical protein